jgi:hypothetical protein
VIPVDGASFGSIGTFSCGFGEVWIKNILWHRKKKRKEKKKKNGETTNMTSSSYSFFQITDLLS